MLFSSKPIKYNKHVGIENLTKEYKEFTFTGSLMIDRKSAEYYCESKLFEFNDNVDEILEKYFKFFISKYVVGYFNSNLNGHLYIGIDDNGFVKGIPYQGNLQETKLKENIYQIIETNVKSTIHIDFRKLIKINFLKVEKPDEPISKCVEIYHKYLVEKDKFNKAYNEFLIKMENWRIRFAFFTQRLIDLANNFESRIMIIEYIRKINPNSSVISLLESNFKLTYCDHDALKPLKEDINNPYYWVCAFKDDMVKIMRASKPIFKYNTFFPNTAINLINSCSEMIPYWMHSNKNMNLYIIHIEFKKIETIYGYKINNDNYFYYKEKKNGKWVKCYRTVLPNGEPYCKPF
jgi:hypothetical protein